MTTPRIYLPVHLNRGDMCRTTADQSRYIGSVLRMKEGDPVTVFNGTGSEYRTVIRHYDDAGALLEILDKQDIPVADVSVTLCQAIPKAEKIDGIIRHATELGVSRIIPFSSTRSVPRWKASSSSARDKGALHRLERWRKIAVEACRQSGRADIPEITDIVTFTDMFSLVCPHGLRLIPWEEEASVSLREVLRRHKSNSQISEDESKTVTLVIGPEGGFSVEEIEEARRHGFVSVSLGKRVLRVETASLAALAIVQYEMN